MAIVLLIKCPDGTVVDAPMFGSVVVIGRSSKADIKIEDPLMSSQHCSLELKNNAIIFKDLGSTNGSFLYNSQIQSVQIKIGDKVRVGNSYIYIDESKLNPKEKSIHANMAGKTQLQFVNMKQPDPSEDSMGGFSPKSVATPDPDAIEKMEAHKKREQNKKADPEKPASAPSKKRPSIGADLAKKVIDNKKTQMSKMVLNAKETNFEQDESSGKTKFLKLEKPKKNEKGPLPKRHNAKKILGANSEDDVEEKKSAGGIMGLLKKILGG